MKKPHHRKSAKSREKLPSGTPLEPRQIDHEQKHVEEMPSVEWGDRIDSGKIIARGGKETGFVPGAMPAR